MKNIKKILAVFFILLLCFSLASCELETEQGNEIKAQCKIFLDAAISEDAPAARNVLAAEMDEDAFAKAFPIICEYISGVNTYTLTQTGFNSGIDNGLSYYEAIFTMKTNVGNFEVRAMEVEGYEGLYNFNITSEEDLNPSYTGTITSIKGSNAFQILILLFSAVCIAFIIFALIDCCKHKMKYKPLWIIIILFGVVAFTVTLNNTDINFKARVAAMLFSYSYLQIYETGALIFNLSIPVGAIVYFFLRKKLYASATVKEEEQIPPEETAESAEQTSEEVNNETENNP